MWYLIIPPIIVVVSLSFVLWYLSRKGADPLVAAQASRLGEEAGQQPSFSRTKNFFLHLLEKIAYRFKVASLQMHNKLHNLTQSLKASQRRFQAKTPLEELSERSIRQEDASAAGQYAPRTANVRRFFGKDRETSEKEHIVFFQEKKEIGAGEEAVSAAVSAAEMSLETPIVRNREILRAERPTGAPQADVPGADLSASRPMVSETAAHPERARRRTPANGFREEDLIARIAADPKDFTAYESLGDYYLETDNVKDAKECYRQVLRLSPVQRMVKIKIRRLEKLLSQKTGGETE